MEVIHVIHLAIDAEPIPAGSHRAVPIRKWGETVGHRVLHDNPRTAGFMLYVRHVATQAMRLGYPKLEPWPGPVRMTSLFYFTRPKSHYGTGKNAAILKPSAPAIKTTKPDLSKLVRALEDGLTGVVYVDDAQIVSHVAEKQFGDRSDCYVALELWG